MFRFDFGDASEDTSSPSATLPQSYTTNPPFIREIPYDPVYLPTDESPLVEILGFRIIRSSTVSTESGESEYDLIPGKYEGGHALWESSIDLCEYIVEVFGPTNGIATAVLELGCGAGLPGIQALRLGSRTVVFSDFNEDVLSSKTWPNIVLNVPELSQRCISCLAGDWTGLAAHFTQTALG